MPSVLFLTPSYLGIYKLIENGINRHLNYDVDTILFDKYTYKSKSQKVLNFLSKYLLGANLKKKWASEYYVSKIDKNKTYDYVFVICPDYLKNKELAYLNTICKTSIVYYWDSFKMIKGFARTLAFFDKAFTFEKRDAKHYNMHFLTNFYNETDASMQIKTDLFFIGKHDERFPVLKKIAHYCQENNINSSIKIKIDRKQKPEPTKGIEFITEFIPLEQTKKLLLESKVLLDINKTIQDGLTFRVFEAMGFSKKIITTNTDIKHYDFYNPNNIFVIDSNKNISIPESFFNTPYMPLSDQVFKSYSLESWLNTIFKAH
jgi:hypothetical protein